MVVWFGDFYPVPSPSTRISVMLCVFSAHVAYIAIQVHIMYMFRVQTNINYVMILFIIIIIALISKCIKFSEWKEEEEGKELNLVYKTLLIHLFMQGILVFLLNVVAVWYRFKIFFCHFHVFSEYIFAYSLQNIPLSNLPYVVRVIIFLISFPLSSTFYFGNCIFFSFFFCWCI